MSVAVLLVTVAAVAGSVAPASAAVTITEFSTGITPAANPQGITAGPDGNLWFTENGANGFTTGVGRITPAGTVTEFGTGITAGSAPHGITAGPDGNLWFTESNGFNGNKIGRITTAGAVTEFSTGITAGSGPNDIAVGPDGNLWFTEPGSTKIGKITTAGVVTEFSSGISAFAHPQGIAAGPDGNLWFTEQGTPPHLGDRIGRITPAGTVTEFSAGITTNSGLEGITAGPDGNLWFTEPFNDQVAQITTAGTVTEFSGLTTMSRPLNITTGPDGNLWFTEFDASQIGLVSGIPGVSNAPMSASAAAGNAKATVSWSPPPSDVGQTVAGYTVTASPGGQVCKSFWVPGRPLSCVASGLANGTPYTFTVKATNSAGTVFASAVSNSVTPSAAVGTFTSLTPARILDTRNGTGSLTTFTPQQTKNLIVAGHGLVPATGAGAVLMNVTATNATAGGWLTLFPTGAAPPTASNLNFGAGQSVPNLVVVKLGASGQVSITNTGGVSGGPNVDVVGDVVGWYSDGTTGVANKFTGLAPTRILDTRNGTGSLATFIPQQNQDLQVGGHGGVPANADSVVLNVTATNPSAGGWLTLFPTGQTLPTASNLNFAAGQSVANLVTVKLGTTGRVSITNTGGIPNGGGTVDVVGDVVGYYQSTSPSALTPLAPQRILDTRIGVGGTNGPIAPQASVTVDPHTTDTPVPPVGTYTGVVVNVTATSPNAGGWLTVYPSGQGLPGVSNLNFAAGQTVANLVKINVGADGDIKITNTGGITGGGTVQIIVDIVGYYS